MILLFVFKPIKFHQHFFQKNNREFVRFLINFQAGQNKNQKNSVCYDLRTQIDAPTRAAFQVKLQGSPALLYRLERRKERINR